MYVPCFGSMRVLWAQALTECGRAAEKRKVSWCEVRLWRTPLLRPPPGHQRWWRSPGLGPIPEPSSGPPPFSTSCAGSETKSWCGVRWGWGSARAPRAAASRCSGWTGIPSRAPAAGRACRQSSCACFPQFQPSRKALKPQRSAIFTKWYFVQYH